MGQLVVDPITISAQIASSAPNANFGTANPTRVERLGGLPGDPIGRTLMDADISAIPAGNVIASTSMLEINVQSRSSSSEPTTIHRITQAAWTEAGVTWNKYDGTNSWTTPGGDYSTPAVPFTGPAANGWLTITGADLAAFLQDALDNQAGIVRILLRVDDESLTANKGFRFYSDDDTTSPSQKPKLTVDYAAPSAAPFIRPVKVLQP